MKIQLKGDLDIELTGLGCKPGDIIEVTPDPVSKVGAMNFARYKSGVMCNCVVWPVNYDVVNDEITPAPASDDPYKKEALKVHYELVKAGLFYEARRLLRSLNNGTKHIQLSLCDTDWSLATFYGLSGAYTIRIRK